MAVDNIGLGTTLTGAATGPLGNVINLSIGGISVADIDFSSSECATTMAKIYGPGLIDPGTITGELILDSSNNGTAKKVFAATLNRVTDTWTLEWPSEATFTCKGYFNNVSVPIPHDDKMTMSFSIKLTELPEFVEAPTP